MSKFEYIEVDALECPFCGALVLADDAQETCWSCEREVAYPGGGSE
jgi:rubrerythrin